MLRDCLRYTTRLQPHAVPMRNCNALIIPISPLKPTWLSAALRCRTSAGLAFLRPAEEILERAGLSFPRLRRQVGNLGPLNGPGPNDVWMMSPIHLVLLSKNSLRPVCRSQTQTPTGAATRDI